MRALLVTAAVVLSLTACSNGKETSSDKVTVAAGDTTCAVATTQFAGAREITFVVSNTGQDVTEVYVYGKGSNGDFDRVVGEVENIAPGTSRDVKVDLAGGDYELACKPGQKGDGIRTALSVAGGKGSADAAYDREIEFKATEYAFAGLADFTANVGEKIEFKMTNDGSMQHEFEVFGPDGKAIGEIGPTDAGKAGEVILELKKAGTYTFKCGLADHASRGMKGTFTVS